MIARVLIKPKDGILDPQGKAVERALPTLGVDSVTDVRIGRMVELHYEDRAELEGLCEKLLVNPLIEDYDNRGRGVGPPSGCCVFRGPATRSTR